MMGRPKLAASAKSINNEKRKQKPTYWVDYVMRPIRFVTVFLAVVAVIFFAAGACAYLIKNSVFLSNFFGPLFTSQLNWVFPLCVKGFFLTGGVLFGGALLLTIAVVVLAVLKNICPDFTAKNRFLSWLIMSYHGQSASTDKKVINILLKGKHYDFLERMHGTQPNQILSDVFVENAEVLNCYKDAVTRDRLQPGEFFEIQDKEPRPNHLMKCPTLTMDALMSKNKFLLLNEIFTDAEGFKTQYLNEFKNRTDIKDIKVLDKLWHCPVLAGVVLENNNETMVNLNETNFDTVCQYYLRSTVSPDGTWRVHQHRDPKRDLNKIIKLDRAEILEKLIDKWICERDNHSIACIMLNHAFNRWPKGQPSMSFLKKVKMYDHEGTATYKILTQLLKNPPIEGLDATTINKLGEIAATYAGSEKTKPSAPGFASFHVPRQGPTNRAPDEKPVAAKCSPS